MLNFIKSLFWPRATPTEATPEYIKAINWPEAIKAAETQSAQESKSPELVTEQVTPVKPKRVRKSRAKVKPVDSVSE